MRAVHVLLGWLVVGGLGLLWLWPLATWLTRRREVHRWFWNLLAAVQVALVLQVVAGVVLLLLGRRQPLLHYLYGSLFPLVVLAGAHAVARDREAFEPWKVFGFAGFIAFGLTLRALTTGLGIG